MGNKFSEFLFGPSPKKLGETEEEIEFDRYIIPIIVIIGLFLLLHPLKEYDDEPNIR